MKRGTDVKGYYLGVDIGSLTTKVVLLEPGGRLVARAVQRSGYRGREVAEKLIAGLLGKTGTSRGEIRATVATGYGRITFPADREVTEISCQARGVARLCPGARTVVDVGGQDSKVVKLLPNGRVLDFVMNDKCAAGTGRFLEVMAQALELSLDDLGDLAGQARHETPISSTCTVFAESEVVSHLAQGAERTDIVAGLCTSVASRVAALVSRVGLERDVVMTGGVARNLGVVRALAAKLGAPVLVPDDPTVTAAYGAALYARDLTP